MTMIRDLFAAPTVGALDLVLKEWIDKKENDLRADYVLFDEYYRGEHHVFLTDRIDLLLTPEVKFRDNFCDVVVDVVVERLEVIGFDGSDEELSAYAWDIWQSNRMDQTQITTHLDAVLKGDSYILVSWDEGKERPRLEFQSPDVIIPHYNPATRMIDMVSKKWVDELPSSNSETVTRMNWYFPDRIEKYFAKGSGVWQKFQEENETEWPQPWVDKSGDPLGVAILHFRSKPGSDDFGMSELVNVIPMQDILNKSLLDLIQILDTQAFPGRWLRDIKASSSTFKVTPGNAWSVKSDNPEEPGELGQFDEADLEGPLRAIETLLQHIAAGSRTPQHLFQVGGGAPSGEALKVAESGLVKKVKQRQVSFGNSWEDVIRLANRLEGTFGSGMVGADDATLSTIWEDPETRNEKEHLEGIAIRLNELGIPRQQAWREAGYTEKDIETMLKEKEEERVTETNLGEAILTSFTRGNIIPETDPDLVN